MVLFDDRQCLRRGADGDHQTAAAGQLVDERLWYLPRRRRCDDDIVRRVLLQSDGSVCAEYVDIAVTETLQAIPRRVGQRRYDPEPPPTSSARWSLRGCANWVISATM